MTDGSARRVGAALLAISIVATGAAPATVVARDGTGVTRHARLHADPLAAVLHGGLARLASGGLSASNASRNGGYVLDTAGGRRRIAVRIDVDAAPGGAGDMIAAAIIGLGGSVVNHRPTTLEAYVPVASLRALGTAPGVRAVRPILRRLSSATVGDAATLQGATAWQAASTKGTGIRVGIIDGGFAGMAERLGRGLPATVVARCYSAVGTSSSALKACEAGGESHGTEVAESLVAMAPGVELYVANPISPADDIATVDWMLSQKVRIINLSGGSGFVFEGPGDGSSPYGDSYYALIDRAVAGGALWVNSAGNSGDLGWSGAWNDPDADDWLEYGDGRDSNIITLQVGESVRAAIRWAEPWGSSTADYAVCIFDEGGTDALDCADEATTDPGYPFAVLDFEAPATGRYDVSLMRVSGAATPRIQLLLAYHGASSLEHRVASPTLPTPADSRNPGMLTVGAVDVASPDTAEPYSSRGPTTDGRTKPDLVAADCAATSFGEFCGTSQSAPFVSGAAALALQANPGLTPAQLAAFLRSRAVPLGSPVPNNETGAGRLDMGAVPAGGTTPPATPAGAVGLAFVTEPSDAVIGTALPVQPAVALVDETGAVVASGPSSTLPITLGFAANTGGGTLACTPAVTATASAGVATFAGCVVDQPGQGYSLVAMSPGLGSAVSAPFTVLPTGGGPMPRGLTMTPSATTATFGQGFDVTFSLAAAGQSIENRLVELQWSGDGAEWQTLGTTTTDSTGTGSVTVTMQRNGYLRGSLSAAPDLGALTSPLSRVAVRQTIVLRPTNKAEKAVRKGTTVTFHATVRPAWDDVRTAVTFLVYRKVDKKWAVAARRVVKTGASGVASLRWTFTRTGQWYVRAAAGATPANAASLPSQAERYRVR
jgi:hypothetical protein